MSVNCSHLCIICVKIFEKILSGGLEVSFSIVSSVNGVAATTFYYSGIKDWNSLPSDVKQKYTFNGFNLLQDNTLDLSCNLWNQCLLLICI